MPDILSLSDYPNMDLADVGLLPNVGYGAAGGVRAHSIVGGATTKLQADITAAQTAFDVDDASRFSSAPFTVQLASERMRVGAKSGNTLSSITRGYDSTTAQAHAAGRTAFEVRTEYVYLLSPEPVKAISRVYVDGVIQYSLYTAYTGQGGDEHTDWPGKAVIAFSAEGYIGRQRNLEDSGTQEVEVVIDKASHRDLMAETTVGVPMGAKGNQKVWAAFSGSGTITSQAYEASVKNNDSGDAVLRAVVRDLSSGSIIRRERVLISGSATKTFTLGQEGGNWGTIFLLLPYSSAADLEVLYMKKTVTVVNPPDSEDFESYSPPVEITSFMGGGIEDTPGMKPKGRVLAWASYPSTFQGTMARQTHTVELKNTGGGEARVRLVAAETSGTLLAMNALSIEAGATETISLMHGGGGWDAMTKLLLISGEVRLDALSKEVFYLSSSAAEDPAETSSARVVIGEAVTADAEWAVDTTGDYGGASALIERPDWVIMHFIVKRMGFPLADIDEASFGAAGSSYASAISGGYKFGFVINREITPSAFIRSLAFQCRSTVKYSRGKWRLGFLPDAAPSTVKTIARGELAGEGAMFTFSKTPVVDIGNKLTAVFKTVYTRTVHSDSDWVGSVLREDSASKTKYGTYPVEFAFGAVREAAMAGDVLDHVLLERKAPLLIVRFPVFYEHFDLDVGDTIDIDNPLYDGKKFYIEKIRRLDKFRAEVEAREWWG
jgi:hypothetical protein